MLGSVHTSCKDCIFAIYSDKTQTDCSFDKIKKLKENGVAVDESFDDEKEFFVINNHACMTYRPPIFLEGKTFEEAKQSARDRCSVRIGCLVMIKENQENLIRIIDSICNQTKQFSEVIFCANPEVQPSKIMKLLNDKKVTFKWSIRHILDSEYIGDVSINVAMQKTNCIYMSVFTSDFIIPNKFVEEIDIALNDDMQRFLLLEPIDSKNNGLTFQSFIFNSLRGNEEAVLDDDSEKSANSIIEKIKYVATTQNLTSMIKKCEDICPCIVNSQE
jgi:hypothetical protein